MPAYRFYRLDGSGKIDTADWLEASADEDALRQADELCPKGRFELWRGQRLVLRRQGGQA